MRDHLFLVGFMGSGKSRWGARLAGHLNRPFIDLDHRIEEREGESIAEIFARRGETAFRELERRHLQALAGLPPAVVSLGGGTPCFFDNMAWVNAHGRSVYLRVPLETLVERLLRKAGQRPLLARLPPDEWPQALGELLEKRTPYYEQAQQTVDYAGDDDLFFERLVTAAAFD